MAQSADIVRSMPKRGIRGHNKHSQDLENYLDDNWNFIYTDNSDDVHWPPITPTHIWVEGKSLNSSDPKVILDPGRNNFSTGPHRQTEIGKEKIFVATAASSVVVVFIAIAIAQYCDYTERSIGLTMLSDLSILRKHFDYDYFRAKSSIQQNDLSEIIRIKRNSIQFYDITKNNSLVFLNRDYGVAIILDYDVTENSVEWNCEWSVRDHALEKCI